MNDNNNIFYLKIAEELKNEIERGEYNLGELLQTEQEMEERFKASRTTVRNAISLLERDGYVIRKQGRGTTVQNIRAVQNLNYISSFTETLKEKGIKIVSSNMSIRRVFPSKKVMSALKISEDEEIYQIQRTRLAEEIPIAFMNNYLLARVVPKLESKYEKLKNIGLYQLLEEDYDLKFSKAVEKFNVYMSGPLDAEILQLNESIPLFHSTRVTSLDNGEAFEYVISIIRSDKFEYTVYMKDRPPKT
jgi:GntR family transcriptional regulator